MFLAVPKKLRGHMNDTDYICQGFSPADYGKDTELKVSSTASQVVWKYRGSEFICRPPYWTAKGKDGDLSYDLKITGTAPTSYYIGDFKKFPKEIPVADFDQFTTCTGTIKAGQKTYPIAKGFGGHEHCVSVMAMGQVFNQRATEQQMLWFVGGGDPLQFFCFSWGAHRYGRIMVGGQCLSYGDNDVTIHTLEHWKDPRSLVTMPCRWHVNMRSPKAIVDVEAVASGRINRIWAMRFGYLLDTWFLGTLNGSVLYPNGRVVPVNDVLYEVEWVRTLWP